MYKSRGAARDPELNSFLSRVEQLDSERIKKKPSVKPKPKNLKYNDDDYEKAEDLLRGSYKSNSQYDTETDRPVSSLAYKSAYNYDKTFSPKKNGDSSVSARDRDDNNGHYENLGNGTRRISKFDDVYRDREHSQGEFVVSKEDYEMLMSMKGGQSVSRPDNFPSRGSARNLSGNEEDFDVRVQKNSGKNPKPKPKPKPNPKVINGTLNEPERPGRYRGYDRHSDVDISDDDGTEFNGNKPLSVRIGGDSDKKKKKSAKNGKVKKSFEDESDDEIDLNESGPVFSSRNFKDHDDIAETVAAQRKAKKAVPPPPKKRNSSKDSSKDSSKASTAKYNIIDTDPVDEFSEVFQKIRLSQGTTDEESKCNGKKNGKVAPKKPAKKSELRNPKVRSSRPSLPSDDDAYNSNDDDDDEYDEQNEFFAVRKSLRKTHTAPSRRDITPEAVKAKSKLNKPPSSISSVEEIPEAMAKRQALLRSSTESEIEKKSSSSLKSLQKHGSKFQKQLIKTINSSQASLSALVSSTASSANSSSDALNAKTKKMLTKVRSKGPKRKLPTDVTKL